MPEVTAPRNSRFVTALFLVVFGVSVVALGYLLSAYLAAIVMALVLVSLFLPVFGRLEGRFGGRRRVAAAATTALVVLVVIIPSALVLTSLSAEVYSVYQRATSGDQTFVDRLLRSVTAEDGLGARVRDVLRGLGIEYSLESLREQGADTGRAIAGVIYQQLRGIASNFLKTLMQFGLMVVLMFALFVEGPRLKAYLLDLSPLPDDQEEMLVDRFASISRAVFQGNGVASLLQGFAGGLGFYLFGIGSGVLWGSLIAFFAFLPIVGAAIVFVPAVAFLLLEGKVGVGVGFLLYNMAYVGVLEYGLKPRLIGGQSQMSSVLVFLGILCGLSLFGILGIFYGPLILTMFLTVAEIYKSEYRDDLMAIRSPWVRSDAADS